MSHVSANGHVRKSEWFRTAVAVSGWAAAAFMGLLNLPAAINDFNKEFPAAAESTGLSRPIDKRFAGAWGRAPDCKVNPFQVGDLAEEARPKGHGVDLILRFDGDLVNGEIISDGLRKNYIFPEVEMVGQASGRTAHMRVFDWMDGKPVTLAEVNITRVEDNCLEFRISGQSTNLFPETAWMVRQSAQDYESIPRESEMINRILKRLSQSPNVNGATSKGTPQKGRPD